MKLRFCVSVYKPLLQDNLTAPSAASYSKQFIIIHASWKALTPPVKWFSQIYILVIGNYFTLTVINC